MSITTETIDLSEFIIPRDDFLQIPEWLRKDKVPFDKLIIKKIADDIVDKFEKHEVDFIGEMTFEDFRNFIKKQYEIDDVGNGALSSLIELFIELDLAKLHINFYPSVNPPGETRDEVEDSSGKNKTVYLNRMTLSIDTYRKSPYGIADCLEKLLRHYNKELLKLISGKNLTVEFYYSNKVYQDNEVKTVLERLADKGVKIVFDDEKGNKDEKTNESKFKRFKKYIQNCFYAIKRKFL